MEPLKPVAGAATGPAPAVTTTAAAARRSASPKRSASSPSGRLLKEGTDFDVMGAEVYKDQYVRVVASGGIPIYTGVGYMGDNFSYKLPFDAVCGAGKGLLTFERVVRDILKEEKLKGFTPDQIRRISKSFLNTPPLDEANMANFTAMTDFTPIGWAMTNKFAKPEDRLDARLRVSDSSRRDRLLADPLYSSHIYFRAPTCWPLIWKASLST